MTMHVTTNEVQAEYVRCMQRGVGFTRHGLVSNYFFGGGQLSPEMLDHCVKVAGPAASYILSYRNRIMSDHADRPDRATAVPAERSFDWTRLCIAISRELEAT
jgi:hypothetical protein